MVTFVGPHVTQDRNAHTYLADLDAEQPLYERSGGLISYLQEWEYLHTEPTLEGALEKLYADLYERDIVEWKDVRLIQLWISALQSVGYEFPAFNSFPRWQQFTSCNVNSGTTWSKPTIATATAVSPKAEDKKFQYDDVVLVGQFNYDTPAELVIHWVKRWGEIFKHVDVRGPFSSTVLDELQLAGVKAFETKSDKGFYSPMKTTADSLRLYAKNKEIRGVIMAHDDLLFNVSHLAELGFPSESIITTVTRDVLAAPYFTLYGNSSFRRNDNSTVLRPTSQHSTVLDDWWWWGRVLRLARSAFHRIGLEKYADDTGGLEFYHPGLSDFLYVPTSLTDEFAAHADWMTENKIFLEVGTPTILGRLQNKLNVTTVSTNTCTYSGKGKQRVSTRWVALCMKKWGDSEYGVYHPVKIGPLGIEKWDAVFDAVVLGMERPF
jgi:hypothetical protein